MFGVVRQSLLASVIVQPDSIDPRRNFQSVEPSAVATTLPPPRPGGSVVATAESENDLASFAARLHGSTGSGNRWRLFRWRALGIHAVGKSVAQAPIGDSRNEVHEDRRA